MLLSRCRHLDISDIEQCWKEPPNTVSPLVRNAGREVKQGMCSCTCWQAHQEKETACHGVPDTNLFQATKRQATEREQPSFLPCRSDLVTLRAYPDITLNLIAYPGYPVFRFSGRIPFGMMMPGTRGKGLLSGFVRWRNFLRLFYLKNATL
eukprot:1949132-Rhodomonas_salina.1